MRCLTLAEALSEFGATCYFICRNHRGNLCDLILAKGFQLKILPSNDSGASSIEKAEVALSYKSWLGCNWEIDAEQTASVIEHIKPDWLVVDHYAIDRNWELNVKPFTRLLMVIDDLADRPHICDLLIDQNLGRDPSDYSQLVPECSKNLIGPDFALLRPEFAFLRTSSLSRRSKGGLKNILITMGGIDRGNATGEVLHALKGCKLGPDCKVTVVLGAHAPWLNHVRYLVKDLPFDTQVLVNVDDMGRRMAGSDLVVGAAGGTAWERACLGVPSIIVLLAENQEPGAAALQAAGAARVVGKVEDIRALFPKILDEVSRGEILMEMSRSAAKITNGLGAKNVAQVMKEEFFGHG